MPHSAGFSNIEKKKNPPNILWTTWELCPTRQWYNANDIKKKNRHAHTVDLLCRCFLALARSAELRAANKQIYTTQTHVWRSILYYMYECSNVSETKNVLQTGRPIWMFEQFEYSFQPYFTGTQSLTFHNTMLTTHFLHSRFGESGILVWQWFYRFGDQDPLPPLHQAWFGLSAIKLFVWVL